MNVRCKMCQDTVRQVMLIVATRRWRCTRTGPWARLSSSATAVESATFLSWVRPSNSLSLEKPDLYPAPYPGMGVFPFPLPTQTIGGRQPKMMFVFFYRVGTGMHVLKHACLKPAYEIHHSLKFMIRISSVPLKICLGCWIRNYLYESGSFHQQTKN